MMMVNRALRGTTPKVTIAIWVAVLSVGCSFEREATEREATKADGPDTSASIEPKAEPSLDPVLAKMRREHEGIRTEQVARIEELSALRAEIAGDEFATEVRDNTEFAFALFHTLAAEHGNVVFSPQSISTAFSWLSAGARGETRDEIRSAMRFSLPEESLHSTTACLNSYLERLAKMESGELELANSLWVRTGLPLARPFEELSRNMYRADLSSVDFAAEPERTAARINEWVSDKTHGRIRAAVSARDVKSTDVLKLVNTAYFKGMWAQPFDDAATRPAPFCLPGHGTVEAPLMHRTGLFSYAEADGVQVIALPYAPLSFSMIILLPRAENGLPSLERRLNAQSLKRFLSMLERKSVEVSIPRVGISFTDSSFVSRLEELGMKRAFSPERSELTGIVDVPGTPIFIDDVVHTANITINEKETEAAALSMIGTIGHGGPFEPPLQFYADHPFLFIIREETSGAVLFMGHVANPLPSAEVIKGRCPAEPTRTSTNVRSGACAVDGPLSKDIIHRVVHRHLGWVRFCYERELVQQPKLTGQVVLRFAIKSEGVVHEAAVKSSTLNNQRVEDCLVYAVERWAFPVPEGGGVVRVSCPFRFDHNDPNAR